jgi:hypothetical protein
MLEKNNEKARRKRNIYLTETILTIHHEVQSAVDYISEVASHESTELGMSSATMGIETLRIRFPFILEVEQETESVWTKPPVLDKAAILKNLAGRKGFLVDVGLPGKRGLYSKIRIAQPKFPEHGIEDSEGKKRQPLIGEIEIVFGPLSRESPEDTPASGRTERSE